MFGAVIGDIVGSVYEHDNLKSKDFPLFAEASSFTDDTLCTVAVAESLLDGLEPAACLRAWGRRYPHLGYGGMFRRWLGEPALGPYGSFGNGAAMRVSPAGFLARDLAEALALADRVTAVTHDHPEGIKGARATAAAVHKALRGERAADIRAFVAAEFGYDMGRTVDDIRAGYRFDPSCQGTVPEALTCAFEARDFEDAVRNAVSIGGDSDTVACIAGAVAEALFGAPPELVAEAKRRLPAEMTRVLERMYARRATPLPPEP